MNEVYKDSSREVRAQRDKLGLTVASQWDWVDLLYYTGVELVDGSLIVREGYDDNKY